MKKVILAAIVFSTVFTSCKEEKKEAVKANDAVKVENTKSVKNNVDVSSSVIYWKGTKPTGSFHEGTVALKEGSLTVENGLLTSGEFVIDMNTIKNTDLKDEGKRGYLVKHLSSADFFEVEKYPTAKFVITSSEKVEDKLQVTGNLTVKDVTKSITIPATVVENEGVVNFKSDTFKINRADFNVKYKSKSFFSIKELKDKVIDDLIGMSFEVKTKK
jgi:polyisoprenoid-binding protein YceI